MKTNQEILLRHMDIFLFSMSRQSTCWRDTPFFYLPFSSIHHNPFRRWCSIEMAAKKWGKAEDLKLADLFKRGLRSKGVSPTDLSTKAIRAVLETHFPDREYRSFAPLFRAKARKWNIDQTLRGERGKYD